MPELEAANVLSEDRPEEVETDVPAKETSPAEPETAGEETEPDAKPKEGETQEHKRLGGWQRKIQKLEREREFWRDEALKTRPEKDKEAEPETDRPKRPKLSEFPGTVEDFEKAVDEYEAKLEKWTVERQEQEAVTRQVETSVASLTQEVSDLPEFDDMRAAVKEHKMPMRLTNLLIEQVAKLNNGAETLKALLLDPEEAAQLAEFDKYEDANSIKAQVISMSRHLRVASKKSEPGEEKPAPAKPPAPINPVRKVAPTATGLSDDLSIEEWTRRREAQIRKK